jgi:outer membrane protein assembly factor BamD
MFRRVIVAISCSVLLLAMGCSNHKKIQNPIANVNSKQPDKVLFDRAMDAMKHGKFDVARLSLQTLINTYPDSEYVARAKLAVGDSWYEEGGTAAMAQAESEYKDFITFFPNMPEAAEAQMKVANIHYKEMEKADRDPTQAFRAQDEYRQLIMQFPDSKLVPEAKQRLLEVQEVLAEREYMIGHFYFMKEAYPAAIARLKSVADTYPLYSGSDQVLYELGTAYEREAEFVRRSKLPEVAKGKLIKDAEDSATEAYDRMLTRYPLEVRADDAKKRLQALKRPIPHATPEAIAQNKAEIASRSSTEGRFGRVMENFHKAPDMTQATKIGEPTMVDPKQASAPELVRQASSSLASSMNASGSKQVSVERVTGPVPDANGPVPRSEVVQGAEGAGATPANADASGAAASGPVSGAAAAGTTNNAPEMKNDLAPAGNGTPPVPPGQVNDAATSSSSADNGSQPANGAVTSPQTTPPADDSKESSSKKKKKKLLGIF